MLRSTTTHQDTTTHHPHTPLVDPPRVVRLAAYCLLEKGQHLVRPELGREAEVVPDVCERCELLRRVERFEANPVTFVPVRITELNNVGVATPGIVAMRLALVRDHHGVVQGLD